MTTKGKTWIRELTIATAAALIGGLLVAFINKAYLSERPPIVNTTPPPFEFISRDILEKDLTEAKTKIEAAGYVLKTIDPDFIDGKVKNSQNFIAKVVMIDPLGSKKVICQRQHDEDDVPRNYTEILTRIKEFIQKSRSSIGNRIQVGLSDVYPTMTVIIVDNDLYVYFFPYHELGSHSPIIKFRNYNQDASAKFFENHLREIFNSAKFLTKEDDYKRYESANSNDPCF